MADPQTDLPHNAGELVNYVVEKLYGGIRKRLAEQTNLSLSYLGKVVNAGWPIGPETALQLAHLSGLPPDYCLRIAGHERLLLLIEDAFGKPHATRDIALDDYQRALLGLFAHFTMVQQRAMLDFLGALRPRS